MLVVLVVKGSLAEEGCRQVVVDYRTAGVGYTMAGEVECRTSEAAGCNLHKQHENIKTVDLLTIIIYPTLSYST